MTLTGDDTVGLAPSPADRLDRPDEGPDHGSGDGLGDALLDEGREATDTVSLFEGDEGRLGVNERRALVALLKHRFLTARTHPAEWRAIVAHPGLLRSRLNDLFLDLHLDVEREVAFKRQAAPDGGGRFPTLLFDTAWSREETILMVFLRSRSRAAEGTGVSRVYVDRQEMLDHVTTLRPATATDRAADARRAAAAVDNLNRAGLLVGQRTADRFEVSPAIDVVLPLERLQELLAWLRTQNGADVVQAALDGADGEAAAGPDAVTDADDAVGDQAVADEAADGGREDGEDGEAAGTDPTGAGEDPEDDEEAQA